MASRADFMRSLGLTDDDLVKPPPEREPRKEGGSRSRFETDSPPAPAARSGGARYDADPSPMPRSQKAATAPAAAPPATGASPTAGSRGGQSRADFLRSMGIDNVNDEFASRPEPARNATGSQELPREAAVPPARKAAYPRASTIGRRDEFEEDEYPTPAGRSSPPRASGLHHSSSSDITLGAKAAAHRGPATPGLDAELKGMSDAAGAEEVKNMGNKYFQAGDYRKAVRLYTRAIELDGMNAALYSNRSAAYLLGSKQMGIDTRSMALRDADKAIKLKPTWFKGFSRRGDALFKLERFNEAAETYESALELDPGNSSILHSLNEVRPHLGKKRDQNSASWSAPGSGDLHASVSSLSGKKSTDKSAFELLDELNVQRERTTPHLTRGGDYKSKQLEQYRQRREGTMSGTFSSEYDSEPRATPAAASTEDHDARPTVTEEFSSDAASAYQQQLLENYRKKKMQQQGRR